MGNLGVSCACGNWTYHVKGRFGYWLKFTGKVMAGGRCEECGETLRVDGSHEVIGDDGTPR